MTTTTTPPEQAAQSRINTNVATKNGLATFTLDELGQYTKEGAFDTNASKDFRLFYVGRDNVHEILKEVLSRVTISLYLNMFGFDDEELNAILMQKAADPSVTMLVTLDKSQSGGIHEKTILASDIAKDPVGFNTHFVIGESATHQISHTKGFVADGKVGGEGSTNWSASGEGTFVVAGKIGGAGYVAQNNTQSIFTDPDACARFTAELVAEHTAATAQGGSLSTAKPVAPAQPAAAPPAPPAGA